MRQYTRLLRIALSILGSFLLGFVVLGLVFTFRIKKSTVTAEAKSLVENLGTKSEIDAASELAALQQTEVQTQAAGLEHKIWPRMKVKRKTRTKNRLRQKMDRRVAPHLMQ